MYQVLFEYLKYKRLCTVISLIQQPIKDPQGQPQDIQAEAPERSHLQNIPPLPKYYINVPPIVMHLRQAEPQAHGAVAPK